MGKVVDIKGHRYGRLTVVEFAGLGPKGARWRCLCECGNETIALGAQIRSGNTKSCGCQRADSSAARAKDETGNKYGRLTVIRRIESSADQKAMWLCLCDCGNEAAVAGKLLRNGWTKSCGCIVREGTHRKHGDTGTRLYRIWSDMLKRCDNPNHWAWKWYGGDGVSVCDEWKTYAGFKATMPAGYTDELTIDRIDGAKLYGPSTTRWATRTEQARNRRSTVRLTLDGETLPVAEWAERIGMPYATLIGRVQKGWTAERALTQPVRRRQPAP